MSLKEPIVEGAYYEREDGSVVGPAVKDRFPGYFYLSHHYYWCDGTHTTIFGLAPVPDEPEPPLTRRVHLVPTDPAEVVAELREHRRKAELVIIGLDEIHSADEHRAEAAYDAFEAAANLVKSRLGLARCGEGCDGNCELTAPGPTKAEAELTELRAKVAEVIAELRGLSVDAFGKPGVYQIGRERALQQSADLVAQKLGVK